MEERGELRKIIITGRVVLSNLLELQADTCPGPDGFKSEFLINVPSDMFDVLALIYKNIQRFTEGSLDWKRVKSNFLIRKQRQEFTGQLV